MKMNCRLGSPCERDRIVDVDRFSEGAEKLSLCAVHEEWLRAWARGEKRDEPKRGANAPAAKPEAANDEAPKKRVRRATT